MRVRHAILAFLAILAAGLLSGCEKPLPDREPLTGGNPKRGQELIAQYGCGACHQIKGIAHAESRVGPSLKEIREQGYVGGVLPNSADNLVKWIVDPPRHSPRTAMPNLGVSEAEARDMAAYLYSQ